MEKKLIKAYSMFLFVFRLGFSFVHATYVLFLLEKGMSFTQIGVINMCFLVGMFLFEVPTGIVADTFGRKPSTVIGIFVISFGTLVYGLSTTFIFFCVAELIVALGSALMSGSLEAWVKSSMMTNGSNKSTSEVFLFGEKVGKIGTILGGTLGAFIGYYNLSLPWFASTVVLVTAGFITIKIIDEDDFQKEEFSFAGWGQHMKGMCQHSVAVIKSQRNILNLIIVSSLLMAGVQALNMQWSPLFEQKIGYWLIPYMWAAVQGSMLLGIVVVNKFSKKNVHDKTLIIYSIVVSAFGVLFSALFSNGWIILIFFLTHEFSRGAFLPLEKAYLQDNIQDEKRRATIASFESMIVRAGAGVAWLFSGILADVFEIQTVWLFSSIFIFIAIIFARKLK